MALVILAAIVLLVVGAVHGGLVPPPTATTLIQIRAGSVNVARGQVSSTTIEHVRSILREEGVASGYIAVTSQRVFFSYKIPPATHQRLRNVLLNRFR
jgi:hypothetical protein